MANTLLCGHPVACLSTSIAGDGLEQIECGACAREDAIYRACADLVYDQVDNISAYDTDGRDAIIRCGDKIKNRLV